MLGVLIDTTSEQTTPRAVWERWFRDSGGDGLPYAVGLRALLLLNASFPELASSWPGGVSDRRPFLELSGLPRAQRLQGVNGPCFLT